MPLSIYTDATPDYQPLTITMLLQGDGAGVVDVISGTVRSDQVVVDSEYYDVHSAAGVASGVLLLVPAWQAMSSDAVTQLAEIARSRSVSAVVITTEDASHARQTLGMLLEDVPLLTLSEKITWRQFEGLVQQAIGEHSPGFAQSPMHPDYLYALADSIAELFGGAVSIENHARTLLAYSTISGQLIDEFRERGVLTRQVPDAPRNKMQYDRVLRSDEPVRFPQYDQELPRAAIAIRAGNLHLGTIWAIDPNGFDAEQALPAAQRRALQRGAELAAGHLMSGWRLADEDAYRREQALRQGLHGSATELLRDLHTKYPLFLVGTAFNDFEASAGDVAQLRLAIDRELRARLTLIASVVDQGIGYFLVTSESHDHLAHALRASLNSAARALPGAARAGISSSFTSDEEQLAIQREEVDAILRVSDGAHGAVCTTTQMRDRMLVDALGELLDERPYLRHPALGAIRGELRQTLLELFAHAGSVARAAERLNVHPNTVRYRRDQVQALWPQATGSASGQLALWATLLTASESTDDTSPKRAAAGR